jgi:hypothetical protein
MKSIVEYGNNHFRCNIILSDSVNGHGSDGIMLEDKSIDSFHIPFPPIVYFHASMLNQRSTIVI